MAARTHDKATKTSESAYPRLKSEIRLDFDLFAIQILASSGYGTQAPLAPPRSQDGPNRSGEFPRRVRLQPPLGQANSPVWSANWS